MQRRQHNMSTECIASPVPRIAHHTASWQGTAQESQVVDS